MKNDRPAEDEPRRKLNPKPRRAYGITLRIHDAPGPLVLTDARAQYDVIDVFACGKLQPQGGAYRMTNNAPWELVRLDDTTYRGMVCLDQLLDEDYHGRGACRWQLTQVRANFRAAGHWAGAVYVPFLDAGPVVAQRPQPQYFWRGTYANPGFNDYPNFGEIDRTRIRHPDAQVFSMTLQAERVLP